MLESVEATYDKKEPSTKEELIDAIIYFWEQFMTVDQCNTYIDHLYNLKVVPVCIVMNGYATGDVAKRVFGSKRSRNISITHFPDLLENDQEIKED